MIFQLGAQFDQPFVANILGDGPRCCVFRRSEGNIYIKSRGPANWGDNKGTFGVVTQQIMKLNFPASAGDWTHDQAFLFTPAPNSGQKGHIHPLIYRGSEQAFYINRQSGLQFPLISPTKVNTMLNGSTPVSTVLSTGRLDPNYLTIEHTNPIPPCSPILCIPPHPTPPHPTLPSPLLSYFFHHLTPTPTPTHTPRNRCGAIPVGPARGHPHHGRFLQRRYLSGRYFSPQRRAMVDSWLSRRHQQRS